MLGTAVCLKVALPFCSRGCRARGVYCELGTEAERSRVAGLLVLGADDPEHDVLDRAVGDGHHRHEIQQLKAFLARFSTTDRGLFGALPLAS